MNSISLTTLVKMKLLAAVKDLFYERVVFRSSNLRVSELLNIAKCSSASMCNCFQYTLIYEDSETTNWDTKRSKKMDAQLY